MRLPEGPPIPAPCSGRRGAVSEYCDKCEMFFPSGHAILCPKTERGLARRNALYREDLADPHWDVSAEDVRAIVAHFPEGSILREKVCRLAHAARFRHDEKCSVVLTNLRDARARIRELEAGLREALDGWLDEIRDPYDADRKAGEPRPEVRRRLRSLLTPEAPRDGGRHE